VGVLKVIFNVLLVPFFFFFFLRDFPAIKHFIKELFPPRHREQVLAFVRTVDDTLAHFIRGQLTVALVLAALYSVGLTLIGLDLAIFLGVLSGLLFLVPYVGIAVAFSLSVLFSLLNFSGWLELVWIGMLYAVLPMVEMFFLTPRIVGVRLRLSPAVVIFALLAFGGLFGVLGVVIALPVTALIKVVGQQLIAWYKSSSFFVSDSPTSSMASTMQTKK
jgi:predicted PurR-regulated permease PerM